MSAGWSVLNQRGHLIVLGIILILGSGCILWLHRGNAGDVIDDGLYLVSAQALRDGLGYRLPSRPDIPTASRFPIGLPAVIATILWISPGKPSLWRDVLIAKL